MPGESTLRRDFIRLQQENKERSEALRRQQLLQEQQLREQEEYKRQLLAERQKRIEQQKEQRRRLEEVSARAFSGELDLLQPVTVKGKENFVLEPYLSIIYRASQNPSWSYSDSRRTWVLFRKFPFQAEQIFLLEWLTSPIWMTENFSSSYLVYSSDL